ncbi:MAG TPA: ROK family protein, partial [Candidatus Aminicenantes bacterium]|nr:ROK family protein [Candidatus Aminicenantes bacterium]
MTALGIDIGGTHIKWGVWDAAGRELAAAATPTPTDLPELLDRLEGIIASAREKQAAATVGIGVPGFIDRRPGKILLSPNLPCLDGFRLGRELRHRSGLPVLVEN